MSIEPYLLFRNLFQHVEARKIALCSKIFYEYAWNKIIIINYLAGSPCTENVATITILQ